MILPLSNPTRSAEDSPEQVWEATAGRALLATGSPFSPVMVAGEWRGLPVQPRLCLPVDWPILLVILLL
ncbi:MAG: malic enzyme-like NAD(P)-binding protein [Aeromonas sp.]